MSKRLGGIIGCKYKTSSWHLIGFPNGSNIGSTVSCRGEAHRYTAHLHSSPCRDTRQNNDKRHDEPTSQFVTLFQDRIGWVSMKEIYSCCFGCRNDTGKISSLNIRPPVLSTCPLRTSSGCGKETRILVGPW